jgi:hypothetical protein
MTDMQRVQAPPRVRIGRTELNLSPDLDAVPNDGLTPVTPAFYSKESSAIDHDLAPAMDETRS